MKAAIYESFGGPIRVRNVPIPRTPQDGVLIRVMATGVCRSDWHGWKGHDGDINQHGLPFCPGHEFSGLVVRKGNQVAAIRVGDRVAVPFILSCGSCRYCQPGRNQLTICARQSQPGFTQWGSFAEYVAVPRADRNLRRLPDKVSFLQAAALGCRFTTAYRALYQQGQLQAEHSVAVFGCGGLGLSCIMLAAARRARIIVAVDISAKALEKASSLGATHMVQGHPNQSPEEIAEAVKDVLHVLGDDDGIDLTLDTAGFATTSEAAIFATRAGGRMVQVGLPHRPSSIPMSRIAGREVTIVGSHGFDAKVLPDLLDLVATIPSLDPCQLIHSEVSLEEGCRALEGMDHSSPVGMVMITDFDTTSSMNNGSRL